MMKATTQSGLLEPPTNRSSARLASRRRRRAVAIALALALVALPALGAPDANAAIHLAFGGGGRCTAVPRAVTVSVPNDVRSYGGEGIYWWITSLYRWNGSSWQFYQWSPWAWATAQASGDPVGGADTVAGQWVDYTSRNDVSSYTFRVPAGYYAAYTWVTDGEDWSSFWEFMPQNPRWGYCQVQ